MTGNSDGVVRMWSLEFVEVADDELRAKKSSDRSDDDTVQRDTVVGLSQPVDILPTLLSGRQTALPATVAAAVSATGECSSSVDSDTGHMRYAVDNWLTAEKCQNDDDDDMRQDDVTQSPTHVVEQRRAVTADVSSAEMFLMDDDSIAESSRTHTPQINHSVAAVKSDMPLKIPTVSVDSVDAGDFCFVTEQDVEDTQFLASGVQRRRLRDGFHWQKQLVFRSKLTMHTAFERKDNKDPAAVTALAVSRDHKSLYVGDGKGRVYVWSVADQPGRSVVDHWVKDEGVDACVACRVKFTFAERRHHCRNCGQLFCARCSNYETEIHRLRIMKPVRVCQACYNVVQLHNATVAGSTSAQRTVNPVV